MKILVWNTAWTGQVITLHSIIHTLFDRAAPFSYFYNKVQYDIFLCAPFQWQSAVWKRLLNLITHSLTHSSDKDI